MTATQVDEIVSRRMAKLEALRLVGTITDATFQREAQAVTLWSNMHHFARFEQYLEEVQ